jgi:hypothetical protein
VGGVFLLNTRCRPKPLKFFPLNGLREDVCRHCLFGSTRGRWPWSRVARVHTGKRYRCAALSVRVDAFLGRLDRDEHRFEGEGLEARRRKGNGPLLLFFFQFDLSFLFPSTIPISRPLSPFNNCSWGIVSPPLRRRLSSSSSTSSPFTQHNTSCASTPLPCLDSGLLLLSFCSQSTYTQ